MISAMDRARFWAVVTSSGPALNVGRLVMVLNSLTPTELRAFCRWLEYIGSELDTPAHRGQAETAFELARTDVVRSWAAPEQQCPAAFGELQATVVACGQDTWNAVVVGPMLLTGGWPTGLGRAFLLAVTQACQTAFPDPPLATH